MVSIEFWLFQTKFKSHERSLEIVTQERPEAKVKAKLRNQVLTVDTFKLSALRSPTSWYLSGYWLSFHSFTTKEMAVLLWGENLKNYMNIAFIDNNDERYFV